MMCVITFFLYFLVNMYVLNVFNLVVLRLLKTTRTVHARVFLHGLAQTGTRVIL